MFLIHVLHIPPNPFLMIDSICQKKRPLGTFHFTSFKRWATASSRGTENKSLRDSTFQYTEWHFLKSALRVKQASHDKTLHPGTGRCILIFSPLLLQSLASLLHPREMWAAFYFSRYTGLFFLFFSQDWFEFEASECISNSKCIAGQCVWER